ncbi:MAG TPA: adenosylcobalamin-dependent ribonucleoside-diphosphate reductase [Planctomycetota bacterium]|nr:adenosylcobalamin-dependent ribonucleoside-diphosphate reductase [Planctomycetota bacterium]
MSKSGVAGSGAAHGHPAGSRITELTESQGLAASRGELAENALRVLQNRYLKKDDQGKVCETPIQLFQRVADHVSSVEQDKAGWSQRYFEMMWDRRFMPNSPTLMNAGRPLGMLSACFVLPLEDSISDIMETARQIALVQRAGGGTGIDLSRLRPSGSIVKSSGGTTEGPLSFLKMLSAVTDAIQQGAFRRGANMGTMRIDHPDVLHFIRLKEDLSKVTNYNLSVTVSNAFMDRVRTDRGAMHVVQSPHDGQQAWLRKSDNRPDYGALSNAAARPADYWTIGEVFDLIVKKAWQSGEPGLIFIDRINEVNPTPNVGTMTSTNPCGEQPLLPYEACNLGSLNLAVFHVPAPSGAPGHGSLDWALLGETVRSSVRFLDDVVEVNNYPTKEIDAMCRANRKIGLGVMGWADLLFKLAVPYDSQAALDLAEEVSGFIQQEAWDEDTRLAEEKGVFANWKGSRWDTVLNRKMRNAHCVTIAPTGTISIIAGCSGGIEPIFSLAFKRQVMKDSSGRAQIMYEINPVFRDALVTAGFTPEQVERVVEFACERGTIEGCPVALPESVLKVFRSARDISPSWHVRMQAAWQKHTDAAVSKTINFSPEATPAEVEEAYLLAYQTGCKGITVYRDGSRQDQPMALDSKAGAGKTAAPAADAIKASAVVSANAKAQAEKDAIVGMLLEGSSS